MNLTCYKSRTVGDVFLKRSAHVSYEELSHFTCFESRSTHVGYHGWFNPGSTRSRLEQAQVWESIINRDTFQKKVGDNKEKVWTLETLYLFFFLEPITKGIKSLQDIVQEKGSNNIPCFLLNTSVCVTQKLNSCIIIWSTPVFKENCIVQ